MELQKAEEKIGDRPRPGPAPPVWPVFCCLEKYEQLKQFLEELFPNQLNISGEIASERGAFEVILLDSGEIVHSKKKGDGYVDSDAKLQRICNAIKMRLESKRSVSDQKQNAGAC
ncbi:selenoprotein W-like [Sphaerodactylus townsendi]|uniref:selenoprotein W-like n=1 Tax=Sphaerodactylus townsendi TaxID=933632 RepID=UPI0020264BAA|nr:selenoprotein W-like [Sphaerodactylus townsendi]